jgi:hypothetical protein
MESRKRRRQNMYLNKLDLFDNFVGVLQNLIEDEKPDYADSLGNSVPTTANQQLVLNKLNETAEEIKRLIEADFK